MFTFIHKFIPIKQIAGNKLPPFERGFLVQNQEQRSDLKDRKELFVVMIMLGITLALNLAVGFINRNLPNAFITEQLDIIIAQKISLDS